MRRPTLIGLLLALAAVFWPWSVGAQPPIAAPAPLLRLVGQFAFESRRTAFDTTLGGLSGLAYDARRDLYYAVSDDRGENQAPRFYTLRIDLDERGIGDVVPVGVTFLDSDREAPGIQPYERGDTDLEDVQLLDDDTLLISSERDRANRPWIRRFALDGTLLGEVALPERYQPIADSGADGRPRTVRGIRPNLGFEGLALTPSQETLWAANEQALAQDGPTASHERGTSVRLLRLERYEAGERPTSEYVYQVEPAFAASLDPNQVADNGVTALVWIRPVLPQFDLLTVERAYAAGVGNDVNLYGVALADATDVRDVEALPQPFTGRPVRKMLLGNLTALGVRPDNIEAAVFGPRLPNGRQSLLLMSDDNFSAAGSQQMNQFVLLEFTAP